MKIEKSARRFDLGELQGATRTPQGFLMCPGFATRTGVFPYRTPSGSIRYELRHPDDVMDPLSLQTLKNAPFTLEHPPEMVTPKNVAKYRKGHVTDKVGVNRDLVEVDVIIEDQDAIDAVEKHGIRQLSCGYMSDIVEEKGVYNGTPYDFRQKNIVYNHLAGVKNGRAGPEVRLRMDSADAAMDGNADLPQRSEFSQEGATADSDVAAPTQMKKVVVMGREVDLPSDVADVVQEMLDRYDEIRAQYMNLEDRMAKRNDVDINQKGVSPQVKVEQQGPDGRAAGGKVGPSDRGGAAKAKGLDAEEDEKKDGEGEEEQGGVKPNKRDAEGSKEKEEKDDDDDKEKKDGGAASEGIGQMKKDMEEMKDDFGKKMDKMMGKIDEYASASMGKGEKKDAGTTSGNPSPSMDRKDSAADLKAQIRARVSLERTAERLVPFEVAKKFDSMSDVQIMEAVVKNKHPNADLSGISVGRLEGRFDSIVEAFEDEGSSMRKDAGREMLEIRQGRNDSDVPVDSNAARLKMLQGGREEWKQGCAAQKK